MYDAHDTAALLREHPHFARPLMVQGPTISLRDATVEDAEFILSLRLDPVKGAHISATSSDLADQRQWLSDYAADTAQLYFIIEHECQAVGTIRMYDQQGTSFCWGSWIMSADAPKSAAIESMLAVYRIGLDLGFVSARFDVRKVNTKVWSFKERFGGRRIGETELSYLYSIEKRAILAGLARYKNRGEVVVTW